METVMTILAVCMIIFGLVYIIYAIIKEGQRHKVWIISDNLIKVICPLSIEIHMVSVRVRGVVAFICPHCSKNLKTPDQRGQWVSVEEFR